MPTIELERIVLQLVLGGVAVGQQFVAGVTSCSGGKKITFKETNSKPGGFLHIYFYIKDNIIQGERHYTCVYR